MSLAQAPWLLSVAVLLTLCAAVWDLRTGLIPNRLVVAFLTVALLVRLVASLAHGGAAALASSLLSGLYGLLLCSAVPLLLYVCNGIGGGDVKLLAVCGLCVGALRGFELQLYAFSLGSFYAVLRLTYEGTLLRSLSASLGLLASPFSSRPRSREMAPARLEFRFGPAIFAATLLVAITSWSQP